MKEDESNQEYGRTWRELHVEGEVRGQKDSVWSCWDAASSYHLRRWISKWSADLPVWLFWMKACFFRWCFHAHWGCTEPVCVLVVAKGGEDSSEGKEGRKRAHWQLSDSSHEQNVLLPGSRFLSDTRTQKPTHASSCWLSAFDSASAGVTAQAKENPCLMRVDGEVDPHEPPHIPAAFQMRTCWRSSFLVTAGSWKKPQRADCWQKCPAEVNSLTLTWWNLKMTHQLIVLSGNRNQNNVRY